jgi:tetratricopeptide (TPR) repeat protein
VRSRSLWHCLRSWVPSPCPRWLKRCLARSEPSRKGHDDQSGETLEAALEAGEQRERQKQAIFQKESRVTRVLAVWDTRPLPDERALPGQIEDAVGQVLRSLEIHARVLDRDHLLKIALRLNDRSALEKGEGRYQLAEALCLRALDIFDKTVVPDHPQLVPVLENYAGILHCAGRSREAALVQARAETIRANRSEERFFRPVSSSPDSRIQK